MKTFFASLLLLIFTATSNYGQDAARQISAATNEVERTLASLSVANDLVQQCTNDIRDTRNSLAAGDLYLSLYQIRSCWVELKARQFAASKGGKNDIAMFETDWQQLGSDLTGQEKLLAQISSARSPAVVAALADASQFQTRPYYQSGRLFALNSSVAEGYYYLGRAPASIAFALFCRQLGFPKVGPQLRPRSLEPELTTLETETLVAYRASDVTSQQSQFNRLNANSKVALELNRAGMYQGALLKYLESILYLGFIHVAVENVDSDRLRATSKETGRKLTSDKADHSIGLLFWQMAESLLNPARDHKPTAAEFKRATVLLDKVLPAYLKYVGTVK